VWKTQHEEMLKNQYIYIQHQEKTSAAFTFRHSECYILHAGAALSVVLLFPVGFAQRDFLEYL